MHTLLTLSLALLCIAPPIYSESELTYKELEDLDAECPKLDTCSVRRIWDSLDKYTCHCGSYCSRLGTCCIDSRYKTRKAPRQKPLCKAINGEGNLPYYLIDYCPRSSKDSINSEMCKQEWQEDSNLMPLVPVTSLSTNQTYKNYFCFRCHETTTEDYLYWEVKLASNEMSDNNTSRGVEITYDSRSRKWMASIGANKDVVPVTLYIQIPDEVKTIPKVCVADAISNCSPQWKIRDDTRKCAMYTSFIYIVKNGEKILYRNPHCAVCNNESLENMGCFVQSSKRTTEKRPFSFTYLLDINRKDGELVGKIQRCDDGSTWDPFFKKCRTLACAIPTYKIKDGKCVPP